MGKFNLNEQKTEIIYLNGNFEEEELKKIDNNDEFLIQINPRSSFYTNRDIVSSLYKKENNIELKIFRTPLKIRCSSLSNETINLKCYKPGIIN
jgi:hypothetical protein